MKMNTGLWQTKMTQKYQTRIIVLLDDDRRKLAEMAVRNAPVGIEIVLREQVKARKPDQNSLYWAGPVRDLESQAWVQGRQFSSEVWHENNKRMFLPENDLPDLDKHVKDALTYRKWDILPNGDRACVGSTTDLTIYGFSVFLEQVYAMGSDLGVQFHAREIPASR